MYNLIHFFPSTKQSARVAANVGANKRGNEFNRSRIRTKSARLPSKWGNVRLFTAHQGKFVKNSSVAWITVFDQATARHRSGSTCYPYHSFAERDPRVRYSAFSPNARARYVKRVTNYNNTEICIQKYLDP